MKTTTRIAVTVADCWWWFWFIGMWLWMAMAQLGVNSVEPRTPEGFMEANRNVACVVVAAHVFWFFAERMVDRLLDKELEDADDENQPAA